MLDNPLLLLADFILVIHALFVLFVVFGLLLTIAGGFRGWHWVRNPWFRLGHLIGIAVVVGQSWMGEPCFLTVWEMDLRREADAAAYEGSFIAYWLDYFLYYEAPTWVFTAVYSLFGLTVLLTCIFIPPRISTKTINN